MNKLIPLVLICVLAGCATTKPHQQYPAELAAQLPADAYAGYSESGEHTHTCVIQDKEALLCRDHSAADEPTPPSGILIQDGIRVLGPQMHAPESASALPLKANVDVPSYQHQIRVTRDALWFDDKKLTRLEDGKIPGEAKTGGARSLFIAALYEAGKSAELAAQTTANEATVVLIIDRLIPYQTLTEVMYTLGQTGLIQTQESRANLLATIRTREQINVFCEPTSTSPEHKQSLTSSDYPIICHPVSAEGRDAPGVRPLELISVGTQPVTMPKIGDF